MTELADRLAKLSPAQRALLDRRMREANQVPAALLHIPRRADPKRSRLTVDQERIWLIHQFDPSDPAYNIFFAARMTGELDTGALQRAVDAFVVRHESMRSTFELDGLVPVMVVHEQMPVLIEHQDLRGVPESEREQEMLRRATEEVRRPFDIFTGPLLRIQLLRTGEREHVLVGTVDHLVWDRASLGIFDAEIAELYTAFVTGREPVLPELEIQYGDYAEWQPHWLREEVAHKHLPYWRRQLDGAQLVLELPTDRPRPSVQTFNGARYEFRLTARLSADIQELARREDVTVNVALLAAWQVLLHRLTGQHDIVVGTTSSTRSRPETEPIIGYFLTMLPLRTTVTPQMSFRELLGATRATMVGAFDHHDIPLGTLLDELDVPRDPSRTPIYQSTFIFVDFHHEQPPSMPGIQLQALMFDNFTAKDDVTLCFLDDQELGEDHFFGLLEYNTDLFDRATIVRMREQLERLLEQVVADPGRAIGELSLMSERERHTAVVEWNRTQVPREPGVGLPDLIRRQARATPDAIAVSSGDEQLSYAQLLDRVQRLAGHLATRGARPEDVVGVCLERSTDLVVGLLGVLMSGAAYLPLDAQYPPARLAAMTADAGCTLLLTQSDLLHSLAECAGERICLDTERAAIDATEPLLASPHTGDDALAYVIYTSGSTGTPKGVEVTHANLANLLLAIVDEIGLGPADVLTAVTSVSFDIAGLELYTPLVSGGQVVVVPRVVAQDGRRLATLLDEVGATVMQATPATWHLLIEAGWRNTSGRKVLVGGEALPPSLAAELVVGDLTWNMYGPTETTIWSTTRRMASATEEISIGHALANTEVYVLDELMAPVPVGASGELYIGGAGVARGYRGRPELTAQRFVDDPFSGRPGARLYRTGDRVRQRADGSLVFLGRRDAQIKLRGYRIELGEIETRLDQHPDVIRSLVMIREDRPDDRRLVGYYETARGELAAGELREHLREFLPDYMVPSAFVAVDQFPLTTSGKINRRALPAPSTERAGPDYQPPRDPLELEVARIWETVLGIAPIGIADGFFDLGGHSLLVLRLMAEIEQRFGTQLPMAAIFQGATVEQFARLLRDGYQGVDRAHLVRIRAGSGGTPVFFAHPAGSEVVCYMPFAKLLTPVERPLYAFASPPPVDGKLPFDTYEQRAAEFARLIREVQPQGPYLLAGWCYGGSNAFAVAHELERAGQQTHVILVDSHPPTPVAEQDEPDRAELVEAIAANLQWDYLGEAMSATQLRTMTDHEQLDYLLGIARAGDYLPAGAGHEQIQSVLDLWTANLRLVWRYHPTPLRGPVTLVRASEEDAAVFTPWAALTSRLDVVVTEGNHYTIMRAPLVERVAEIINKIADEDDRKGADA